MKDRAGEEITQKRLRANRRNFQKATEVRMQMFKEGKYVPYRKKKQPMIDLLTGKIYPSVMDLIGELYGKNYRYYYKDKAKGRYIRYIEGIEYTREIADFQSSQTNNI